MMPFIPIHRDMSEKASTIASLVGERRLLEDRQVLYHATMDDVLHDLVDKIDLSAVQVHNLLD